MKYWKTKAVCHSNGKQWYWYCNEGEDTLLIDDYGNGSTLTGVLMYKDFMLNDSGVQVNGGEICVSDTLYYNQLMAIVEIKRLMEHNKEHYYTLDTDCKFENCSAINL